MTETAQTTDSTVAPTIRVASAPCSFGVDEVLSDDAWMPAPAEMLDWMSELGYAGTELGPPGFLGEGDALRAGLDSRGLALVGAFLPQHFSRTELVDTDRAWLRRTLRHVADGTPDGSSPVAVLCEAIDEPIRLAKAGRIDRHPEAALSPARWDALVSNLHRAAEVCRTAGFEAVFHPHAGTYVETAAEIERLVERIDPSLVGLCLDTGHFTFGGADPVRSARDYRDLVRHVHLKDCRVAVREEVAERDGDLSEALKRGVFSPLGEGDVDVAGVLDALREIGYGGWLVVEQDQFLTLSDTRQSLVAGQGRNREFLRRLGV